MTRTMLLAALLLLGLAVTACSGDSGPGRANGDDPIQVADATVDFWNERANNDPADFVALTRLGAAHAHRARLTGDVSDYGRAAEVLESARAMVPTDAGVAIQLGFVRAALHDFSGALDLANQALEEEPSNAAAFALKGDALLFLAAMTRLRRPSPGPRSSLPASKRPLDSPSTTP